MICETCNGDHNGAYGSGRFCSKKCARSFSTKAARKEINEKVSQTLTGRHLSESHIQSLKSVWKSDDYRKSRKLKPLAEIESILVKDSSYSTKYVKERILVEGLKKYQCEECFITDTYNGKPITLQLHHMNGINSDNRIENLQLLCPNCHTQTDNWAGRNRSLRKR